MLITTTRSSISSALLMLSAFALGCGDDGGDDNGDKPKPVVEAGPDSGGGDAGLSPGNKTYSSTLVPITADNDSAPIVVPHQISLLDGKGAALNPPVSTTSGTDGKVALTVPSTATSIYVVGVGTAGGPMSTYDTIVANHNWESGETLLRISSAGTLSLAAMTGGFTARDDRAALSGAVYWTTDGKVRKGPVGCAKIFIDGATEPDEDQAQRYIGNNPLPAPLAVQAETTRVRGQFYFGNAKTGDHTIKVSLDNGATFVGEKTFYIGKTRADAMSPTKSMIYQIGIDLVAPTNPTPASCPQ